MTLCFRFTRLHKNFVQTESYEKSETVVYEYAHSNDGSLNACLPMLWQKTNKGIKDKFHGCFIHKYKLHLCLQFG